MQVSADSHVHRLFGLRLVNATLADHFDLSFEHTLDRALHGIEPFGSADQGTDGEWQSLELERAALLVIDFAQDIQAFFRATSLGGDRLDDFKARARIVGKAPAILKGGEDRREFVGQEAQGHAGRMRPLPPATEGVLLRRSVPYRRDGKEGLA